MLRVPTPGLGKFAKGSSFFCHVEVFEVGEKASDSRLGKVEDVTSFLKIHVEI